MNRLLVLSAICVMIFCSVPNASAMTIAWTDFTEGSTTVYGDGWQASGHNSGWDNSGVFAAKTLGGVSGVGIAGGIKNGEIDWQEKIRIDFDIPSVISEFQLLFFNLGGGFGDTVDESAVIWVLNADGDAFAFSLTSSLTPTGSATATWDGLGSVENLCPDGGYPESSPALWRIYDNPFGDIEVASIVFVTPDFSSPSPSDPVSSYSFVSLTTSVVPVSGSVWLLGSGLLGLIGLRRKSKNLVFGKSNPNRSN